MLVNWVEKPTLFTGHASQNDVAYNKIDIFYYKHINGGPYRPTWHVQPAL